VVDFLLEHGTSKARALSFKEFMGA